MGKLRGTLKSSSSAPLAFSERLAREVSGGGISMANCAVIAMAFAIFVWMAAA